MYHRINIVIYIHKFSEYIFNNFNAFFIEIKMFYLFLFIFFFIFSNIIFLYNLKIKLTCIYIKNNMNKIIVIKF